MIVYVKKLTEPTIYFFYVFIELMKFNEPHFLSSFFFYFSGFWRNMTT